MTSILRNPAMKLIQALILCSKMLEMPMTFKPKARKATSRKTRMVILWL